jgi:hypothetical protein
MLDGVSLDQLRTFIAAADKDWLDASDEIDDRRLRRGFGDAFSGSAFKKSTA